MSRQGRRPRTIAARGSDVILGALMRVLAYGRRVGVLAVAVSLGGLALTVLPAAARPGPAAAATALVAQLGQVNRSNVGATHSPQVLHQLAGPAAAGSVSSGQTEPLASTQALQGALQGVDVASYQHPSGAAINWGDVAAGGIQFAAVKATEGAYYQNPYGVTDLGEAQAAGLSVIAYAFAVPGGNTNSNNNSPLAQANYLLSYLGAASGTVPIMLDIEYDPYVNTDHTNECYGLSPSAMVSWISAFSAQVRSKTGQLPIIYTAASWWSTCTGGSTAFGQDPLWVPGYASSGAPSLPAGWGNWSFWQYSSTGTVSGINDPGFTDLDQLNPAVIALLNPGAQQNVAGSAVDWQLKQADRVAGQVPSFSAAGLPTGVSVSAGGQVTGWPDRPGTYPVKVTATDGQGVFGSVSFTWTVKPAPDVGPTGPVRLDLGGKCLNDPGNSSVNGTRMNIWTCNGGARQQWTIVQNDTVRIHGKCLDAYHSGTAAGTPVDLYSCNGGRAQQWRLGTGGQLVNPVSGKCLADPSGSTVNGTQVQIRSCTGMPSVKWTLPAGPVVSQIPGMCLNDAGNATANGTAADLSACDGSAAQAWTAEPDNTVRIHGQCLDVSGSSLASGTPADLYTCDAAGTQHWRLVARGAGVSLVNAASGLCLADPADATASGTQLQVVTCAASDPGMTWRVH